MSEQQESAAAAAPANNSEAAAAAAPSASDQEANQAQASEAPSEAMAPSPSQQAAAAGANADATSTNTDGTGASDTTGAATGAQASTDATAQPAQQAAESSSPDPSGVSAATATPDSSVSGHKSTSAPKSPKSGTQLSKTASQSKADGAAATHSKSDISKKKSSPANGAASTSPAPARSSHRRKRTKLGDLNLSEAKIGFLGAGKMAESTINGLIHYAKISPSRIHVAAPTTKGLERFKALGCRVTKRNYDIFGRYDCDIIFLCFHGYVVKHCYKLGGVRPHPITTNYIPHQRHPIYILSLVSGVSLAQMKACLLNPESNNRYVLEIHRIMMNTAVGHGLGICAIDCEPDSKKLSAPIRQLLSSIAHLEHVPASQMDAACAIGGSGLAFSYYFINALADGAFRMGLSRKQAIRFASKTAQCAAQTMLESGKHPSELRDTVSSPSGAAIYGIHVLEKNDVASGVTAAVEAAHKRANDLATQEIS